MKTNLETHVRLRLKQIKDEVIEISSLYAIKNLPHLKGDSMKPYWEPIHHQYQNILEDIRKDKLRETSIGATLQTTQRAYDDSTMAFSKYTILKLQLPEVNNKLAHLQMPRKVRQWPFIFMLLVLFCIGEGIFNIKVVEYWGLTFGEAVIVGLLLAVAFFKFGLFVPWLIQQGQNDRQRKIIAGIIAISMVCLFTYMGIARAEYITDLSLKEGVQTHTNPLPFILLPCLFFTVAIIAPIRFAPSQAEWDASAAYKQVKRQKIQIEAEIRKLERIGKDSAIERDRAILAHLTTNEEGASLEQMVITEAFATYPLMKTQNLLTRHDQGKPDCFSDAYPFLFKTYFSTSLNAIKQ